MTAKNSEKNKKKAKTSRIIIGSALGVLVIAAGAVTALLLLGGATVTENRIERIIDYGTVTAGVSVNGIDISGMTNEQALEATGGVEQQLLGSAVLNMDVDGLLSVLSAQDLGLYTDYSEVLETALSFGRQGSFEQRKQEIEQAKAEGMGYEVIVWADEGQVESAVALFKSANDIAPKEAGYEFVPWGYYEADGTKYVPSDDEISNYLTTISKKREYTQPEGLARIAPENMPNQLRYQYYRGNGFYRDKHNGEVYIPKDSDIARFVYIEESKGIDIDAAATTQLIMDAVKNASFGITITVPAQITHSNSSIEQAKHDTQLITSWTSYLSHDDTPRVYNVAKLSSIINGIVLMPGETWSINETTGNRTNSSGWKDAPGYTDGITVDQPGGGVCQVSSTLYNALLRTGLKFGDDISSKRHSRVSDYIPIGLDATISSGGPDLKITNPFEYPLFIVSFMDGKEKCVTVEIYGRPPVDETGREVVYSFTSKKTATDPLPQTYTYYDKTATPDGTAIPAGTSVEYRSARSSVDASVYVTVYDLDGNVVKEKELLYKTTYPSSKGEIFCNFPDPATLPPEEPEEPGDGNNGHGNDD